jgi:hypothetical protein
MSKQRAHVYAQHAHAVMKVFRVLDDSVYLLTAIQILRSCKRLSIVCWVCARMCVCVCVCVSVRVRVRVCSHVCPTVHARGENLRHITAATPEV